MQLFFFFFKQKTAYEMRISDWSSDVCSSDLVQPVRLAGEPAAQAGVADARAVGTRIARSHRPDRARAGPHPAVAAERSEAVRLSCAGSHGRRRRSEERRVGKEGVSTLRYRWLPSH